MPDMNGPPPIVLLSRRIDHAELSRLVQDGFRDLVGRLWLDPGSYPRAHRDALRHLLLFSPATARQIPFVLGEGPSAS